MVFILLLTTKCKTAVASSLFCVRWEESSAADNVHLPEGHGRSGGSDGDDEGQEYHSGGAEAADTSQCTMRLHSCGAYNERAGGYKGGHGGPDKNTNKARREEKGG